MRKLITICVPGGCTRRYTKGCALTSGASPGAEGSYTHVREVVKGAIWADGKLSPDASIVNVSKATVAAPPDVVATHVHWDEATAPSFERSGTADAVVDCHATG